MSDVFEAEVESEQIVDSDPDPGLIIPGLSNETSDAEAAWNLCNLHEQRFDVEFPHDQDFFPANTTVSVPSDTIPTLHFSPSSAAHEVSLNTPNFHFTEVQNEDPTSKPHHDWALVRSIPDISVISPQEQFLMSHYSNRVVNLFCVIDNAKSPWKTIHLPRVLQCVGELSLGATTTRIRNALRKSLLSISAFCLSNDHRTNNRSTEAEKWSIAASRYRCDAIGLLKYAVETDLYADNRPKYIEFLSTMLSMVTINVCELPFALSLLIDILTNVFQVMSGDTSTCSVHLDGAEKLISHMNIRKSIFSRKAKSLHRIYLYLRVIYESTVVRPMRIGVSRFSPSLGCHKTFGPQPVVRSPHFPIEDEEMPSSTIPMMGDMGMDDSPLPGLSSYECIYGIPQCLLLLLKESIEVIDEVTLHRTNSDTTDIPEPLVQICDDLEQKIMDWPLEERLNLREDFRTEISATIIYHQTRAFINALIIFFSQGVRLMSHRYLRQYVQKVLESIEAIEQIKAETKVLAAPLFWPAFMGATEAFEPTHQERFRRWYARVEIYGIEAARTGIKVVHEVWRQGPPNYRQMHTGWRGVVRQRDECLMLT